MLLDVMKEMRGILMDEIKKEIWWTLDKNFKYVENSE